MNDFKYAGIEFEYLFIFNWHWYVYAFWYDRLECTLEVVQS